MVQFAIFAPITNFKKQKNMKKVLFYSAIIALAIFTACGDKKEDKKGGETKDTTKTEEVVDLCTYENAITMVVKGYKYQMKGDVNIEIAKFEAKQSIVTTLNDSTIEVKMSNYTQEELVNKQNDAEQIDILVTFRAKNGKKIEAGVYKYNDYQSDIYASANIIVIGKGTVWFNWVMGMPEQGTITIEQITDEKICGNFNLNVDDPKSDQIGTVRLNGKFSVAR
ncbi:MAG: hypothetical protein A2W91_04405 [Bacteroidetes bacterium GWF2_38_335]|nr:MAG: hypothetical protein A2W91_04405 [Bacteroidetes bacterium GWF2_38_335]